MEKSSGKEDRKGFWSRERCFQILALIFVLILCFLLIMNRERFAGLEGYGYFGVFLSSLISCATIVAPAPGWLVVVTLGGMPGFNSFLVGLISGVGATIGEMVGYMLGYGGRVTVGDSAVYHKVVAWMKRWGGVTIFVLALIPNPLFDIVGAVAGLLRFPLWKFALFAAAGNILKHNFYAHAGAFGMKFFVT